jgi:hypothetical protein
MMSQQISRGKGLGTDAFTDAKWLKSDANQTYRMGVQKGQNYEHTHN